MYAVIRAGGKQYRVAPGDVIKVEKLEAGEDGRVQFDGVLAVSTEDGKINGASGDTHVVGEVVEEGRGDKILVFHYKRKKQYKKLNGHRQAFTAVRIAEISVDGQSFKAPEVEAKPRARRTGTPKAEEGGAAPTEAVETPKRKKTTSAKGAKGSAGGAGSKTANTRYAGGSKATGSISRGGNPPKPTT